MVLDLNAKYFFYRRFDVLDARIAEFDDFSGIGADDMVVLLGAVRFFKLGDVLSELVLADQVAGEQQFNCVVERCAGNPVILVFHLDVQGLDVEMAGIIVDFYEYGEAFRSFPVPILFEISRKNVSYCFL